MNTCDYAQGLTFQWSPAIPKGAVRPKAELAATSVDHYSPAHSSEEHEVFGQQQRHLKEMRRTTPAHQVQFAAGGPG